MSGQNMLIEGERRVGKSSLIVNTANKIKNHHMVYIDINQIKSVNDLIARITNALISANKQIGAFEKIIKMLSHLRPSLSIDSLSGNPSISFHTSEILPLENIENLLDLIYKDNKSNKTIVVFDEFQNILNLNDSDNILAMMRSRIQFHSNMTYIFSGSVRNDMNNIFYDPDSPFFKSAIKIEVGALPRDDLSNYLTDCFKQGNRTLEKKVIEKIYIEAGDRVGDIQELCNALWSITENDTTLTETDVTDALNVVFAREKDLYEYNIDRLTSHPLRCLTSVAHLGGLSIQSATFLEYTGIIHASSVKKAINRLVTLKILYYYKKEYIFNSPFLKSWLKQM
jgi:AAA+ ATPase superfamily predicted ATPase